MGFPASCSTRQDTKTTLLPKNLHCWSACQVVCKQEDLDNGQYLLWLDKPFNIKIKAEGSHVILMLDNATSHTFPTYSIQHVQLVFLPPNCTSILQPLDQGKACSTPTRESDCYVPYWTTGTITLTSQCWWSVSAGCIAMDILVCEGSEILNIGEKFCSLWCDWHCWHNGGWWRHVPLAELLRLTRHYIADRIRTTED